MPSHTVAKPGALTGLTLDEETDKPVVYGVYQIEAQDAPNVNLQEVYGTTAMPVFEWVKTIQTGQRTYTPSDPFDQEMLDKYKDLTGELVSWVKLQVAKLVQQCLILILQEEVLQIS